ncbi:MAG: hypothetical protein MMC33_002707 [Icmadophila ericetorum]|nr:hypothetical protein [Icmadophila ericetorum]
MEPGLWNELEAEFPKMEPTDRPLEGHITVSGVDSGPSPECYTMQTGIERYQGLVQGKIRHSEYLTAIPPILLQHKASSSSKGLGGENIPSLRTAASEVVEAIPWTRPIIMEAKPIKQGWF